ncbi:MAG: type III secretion system outer membrane ring subunit SctC [Desulfovibrionaceae bacterium]|nr:type III secretion system outer membrane ring subunit SctC [Desulfovibrionaceae bacterium]
MAFYTRAIVCILIVCSLCITIGDATPIPIPWNSAPFSYKAKDTPIATVLRAFATSQGVAVSIPNSVRGNVTGGFYFTKPKDFLDLMQRVYGIVWYYDGKTVFFYTQSDYNTTLIRLRFITAPELKKSLQQLNILDTRFGWKEIAEDNLLQITGPPRYIAAIMGVIQEIENNASQDMVMEVFRLKNAWADDMDIQLGGKTVTLPGVATLLRSITSSQPSTGSVQNRPGATSPTAAQRRTNVVQQREELTPETKAEEHVRILADPRINAVIVWDARERMNYYSNTISKLDVAVPLVEIQVAIVDVNIDDSRSVGMDLGFSTNTSGTGSSVGGAVGSGNAAGTIGSTILPNLTTVYTRGIFTLMARLNALEKRGVANILSRPKILTLNNQEAVIQNKNTFYVRVTNQENTDLFDVSYGTTVRVTPHIIDIPGSAPSIKMKIDIEDGAESSASGEINDLPTITTSVVSTQAIVGDTHSLIIGGHYYEKRSKTDEGVPGLKSIPYAGVLFGTKTSRVQKAERLFIITPRIVDTKYVAEQNSAIPEIVTTTIDHQEIEKELRSTGCTKTKGIRRGILKDM